RVHRDVRDRHPVARLPRARLPPGARLLPAAPAPLRPDVRPGRAREAARSELGEVVAGCGARPRREAERESARAGRRGPGAAEQRSARRPEVWGAGLGLAVIGGLMFPLLHADDLAGAMHRLGLSLLGVLYVGFFTPHFVLLREADHDQGWRWVLFTVFAAMGSDSGGYLTGRAFGRHPLAPS